MATGPSRQSLERLQRDLSSGRVIDYRRVPTRTGFSRRYYDPRNPSETVSENYVLRVYRPSLDDIERAQQQERSRQRSNAAINIRFANINTRSLVDTYVVKQASQGNVITIEQAYRSSEFRTLAAQLRGISFEARQSVIGTPEREALYSPNGEYAMLLVALGRRLEDETFDVGQSPKAVDGAGGYINNTVLPSLQERANIVANGG